MKRIRYIPIVVVIATVIVLSGCSMAEPEPTPSPAEQAELVVERVGLIGTNWEVESFGETEDNVTVLPETKLTLNMMVERDAGYDGCNWFSGVYDSVAPELKFYPPARTAFICQDSDVSAQASTYSSALINITHYEMDGDKLVTYTVGDQKMVTFVPAQPVEIEGAEWTAKFVNDGQHMTPASAYEFTVSAVFENGKVTGNGGCNDYEADYVVDGDAVTFSNIVSAGVECTDYPGSNNVEKWYFAALEETTNFYPLITSMIFTGSEGQDTVFFGTP